MKREEITLIEEMIDNCRNKKDFYVDADSERKAIALEKLLKVYKTMQTASKKYHDKNRDLINNKLREKYYKEKETIGTYYQRNKENIRTRINKNRTKKVEELRKLGITNAWSVIVGKSEPKYGDKK